MFDLTTNFRAIVKCRGCGHEWERTFTLDCAGISCPECGTHQKVTFQVELTLVPEGEVWDGKGWVREEVRDEKYNN